MGTLLPTTMQTYVHKIKKFFSQKKIWIPTIIVVLSVLFFLFKGDNTSTISVITPTGGTLTKSVKATGQVTSHTDLDLSFNKQGVVKTVSVEVGDKVRAGDVLATLDAGSEYALVTQARGSLAQAEAKKKSILEGASNEEITLAKVNLDTAKKDYENVKTEQETKVANAYSNLLNSTPEAISTNDNATIDPPTISGTYTLGKEGSLFITFHNAGNLYFSLSGLASGTGTISTTKPQPIGNTGLYILASSTADLNETTWVINIPNKKAAAYLTNQNAYQSALRTQESALSSAQSLIDQRTAELAVKQASARDSDVALADAEVLSAQGGLEKAQADYENNILRAPAPGTVTRVDIKIGELSDVHTPVVTVEDVDNLYVEADINESSISSLTIGQKVSITIDGLGTSRIFTGVVSHINPSSVTTDGIVNYKIKVSIDQHDPDIRPGMNAEITVIAFTKDNTISVPKAAVVEENGISYVNLITDLKKKKFVKKEVVLGETGDGNMVEVVSGLTSVDKLALVQL